jgi:hypothetical protein
LSIGGNDVAGADIDNVWVTPDAIIKRTENNLTLEK